MDETIQNPMIVLNWYLRGMAESHLYSCYRVGVGGGWGVGVGWVGMGVEWGVGGGGGWGKSIRDLFVAVIDLRQPKS